jgi:hypothetical protein
MNLKSQFNFDSNNYILDIDIINKAKRIPLLSLNIRTLLFLAIVVTVLLAFSCSEKEKLDVDVKNYNGVVVDYSDLDGCGLIIELDNGDKINPIIINTPNLDLEDGQNVEISYEAIDTIATACMVGINAIVTFHNISDCDSILFDHTYDTLPRDEFVINYAKIEDDCLEINVSYSGGCKDHEFILAKIDPWCGTPPIPPTTLELRHNANNDMCEAYLTNSVFFNLIPLQMQDSTSTQIILITNIDDNYSDTLTYNY